MLSQFMDGDNNVRDGIVKAGGIVVGLFMPSTIIGNEGSTIHVNGKNGIASFEAGNAEQFWVALIKSGAILFGSPEQVETCISYLKDPRLSRTCSYLCTESSNCADLIAKLNAISSSSVVIIGCGGIGSLTAMNLAGAGVPKIMLVDHDTIEESNLNRQFFWTKEDIGLRKVEVLRQAISARYPQAEVSTDASSLTVGQLVSLADAHDACVVTADEPLGISAEIADSSRTFVASGSYFHGYSSFTVRLSTPKGKTNKIHWARGPGFIAPSFGPANTEIAGAVSSTCLNYLASRKSVADIDLRHAWRSNRINNQEPIPTP